MKKSIITILVLLITFISYSQVAQYGKLAGNDSFSTYITKSGDTIRIGETLKIGKPSGEFGFVFITQGNERVVSALAGKDAVISNLKSFGSKKNGYKMFALFKGYGLVPVAIDFENAVDAGEVINPKAKMTRQMAISKLKEAKELLDLQMMTQDEYDELKAKLSPVIMDQR